MIPAIFLTNVNNVAFSVDHDVAVVSIFDLKDVASHRIRSHGLDEVQASLLESDSVRVSIFGDEESHEVVDLSPTHFISRGRV